MPRGMKGPPVERRSKRLWYLLLGLPLLAILFPQLYASGGPELLGIPFFYWYQLAVVVLSGIVTGVVYYATR
jgi:uncharacterized protein DUF3311